MTTEATAKKENYLTSVRNQYEELPYPPRDPEEDKTRLVRDDCDLLDAINHYCYEGKQTFEDNFRVLLAGGGTGSSTIFLGEQLRHTNAEIVYLDFSAASLAIAKRRAEIRGLDKITFIHDSLLNIPDLNLGKFDYINCTGVLHHLEDPDAGLKVLVSALKDDGAMLMMVYAKHARAGIYRMQELMRMVNRNTQDTETKLTKTKKILEQLPASNLFKLQEILFNDHRRLGNSGIYDMFLHSQDRAYSIPEFYDFTESAGLQVRAMVRPAGEAKMLYDPASYIRDVKLNQRMAELSQKDKAAVAELVAGNLVWHAAYLSKRAPVIPSIENEALVPFIGSLFSHPKPYDTLREQCKEAIKHGPVLKIKVEKRSLTVPLTAHTSDIMHYLDGRRSTGEILDAVMEHCRATGKDVPEREELKKEMAILYNALHLFDWMLLRDKQGYEPQPMAAFNEYIAAKYGQKTTLVESV